MSEGGNEGVLGSMATVKRRLYNCLSLVFCSVVFQAL